MKKRVKRILLILAGAALLLCILFLCEQRAVRKISENFTLGNSGGRILSDGLVTESGGKIFYSDLSSNGCIYSWDTESGNKEKITDRRGYNINVIGDYMFYIDGAPGSIYKMNLKTGSERCISLSRAENLIVTNEFVFYKYCEENSKYGRLYRADLLGFNKKVLAESVNRFTVTENCIYYIDSSDGYLYKTDFDGSFNEKLIDVTAGDFAAEGEYLYYTDNSEEKSFLYRMKTDGSENRLISEDKCWNIAVCDGYVYYRNMSDKGRLYRISSEGEEKSLFIDSENAGIGGITENYFFYSCGENSECKCYARDLAYGDDLLLFKYN
ncbi:MAG: DUF5050 domain-containing protein [Clostridiales bacterium]|nr:DUF5050 domain-containing protein [Clostridiales bacterium]